MLLSQEDEDPSDARDDETTAMVEDVPGQCAIYEANAKVKDVHGLCAIAVNDALDYDDLSLCEVVYYMLTFWWVCLCMFIL